MGSKTSLAAANETLASRGLDPFSSRNDNKISASSVDCFKTKHSVHEVGADHDNALPMRTEIPFQSHGNMTSSPADLGKDNHNNYRAHSLPPPLTAALLDSQLGLNLSMTAWLPFFGSKTMTLLDEHICICAAVLGWDYVRQSIYLDPHWETLAETAHQVTFSLSSPEKLAWIWLVCMTMKVYAERSYQTFNVQNILSDLMIPGQTVNTPNSPTPIEYAWWPAFREYFMVHWYTSSTDYVLTTYMENYPFRWPPENSTSPSSSSNRLMCFTKEFRQRLDNPSSWGMNKDHQILFPEAKGMLSLHFLEPRKAWGIDKGTVMGVGRN